jgi:hypothetical protein
MGGLSASDDHKGQLAGAIKSRSNALLKARGLDQTFQTFEEGAGGRSQFRVSGSVFDLKPRPET